MSCLYTELSSVYGEVAPWRIRASTAKSKDGSVHRVHKLSKNILYTRYGVIRYVSYYNYYIYIYEVIRKRVIIKHNIYGNNLLILNLKYPPKLTNLIHCFFHLLK